MFAEKSTNLLRACRRLTISKLKCVQIKYHGDQRYTTSNRIATHDQILSSDEAYVCHQLNDLSTLYPDLDLNSYDVICIDEIQFYPDSLDFCLKWRSNGKIIIACGLYADFQRRPFPNLPELIAHADQTEFLKAICHDCSQDSATTSFRLTKEVQQVSIGGSDKYHPLCQICYEKRQ
jgi:thymidine kinase